MEIKNIIEPFLLYAAKHPEQAAIIEKSERISFGELEQSVRETAAYFIHKGIRPGDRVLVFVPMGIDLYRSVLALFYIGATAVFLDEWVNKKRMELCCKIADCKAFIGTNKALLLSWLFSKELRNVPITLGTSYKKNLPEAPYFKAEENSTALITFTTGSTGTPKAAKRTHYFLWEQFKVLVEKLNPKEGDIDMPVLPIVLLINLGAGVTSVIADFKASKPQTLRPHKIYEQLLSHKVTSITSSPFFIKVLAGYIHHFKKPQLPIKKIFTGGAPVFPSEAKKYVEAFPDADIQIVYGSTEAEPISSISANELIGMSKEELMKGLKVGQPNSHIVLRIIHIKEGAISVNSNKEWDAMQLNPGEVGEIVVSGPHVLKEYYNNDEAFRLNKIIVGQEIWHRTGDAGFLDAKGELNLLGRCSRIIDTEDGPQYPFLIENFLAGLNGISAGTLVKKDNVITIFFEFQPAVNQGEILNYVNNEGIKFNNYQFIKHLPRDPRHRSKFDYASIEKLIK